MQADKIPELVWIRRNRDKLTLEENRQLKELGVFDFINQNQVKLPILEFVMMLHKLDSVVYKYTSTTNNEKNQEGNHKIGL